MTGFKRGDKRRLQNGKEGKGDMVGWKRGAERITGK